jgi:hypothetical protein
LLRRNPDVTSLVLCFEVFGVRLELRVEPLGLGRAVDAILPPGRQPCDCADVHARFAITETNAGVRITKDDGLLVEGIGIAIAIEILDAQMRMTIATAAPEVVFVHAGAVAVNDEAIVLPGKSFAGKTTLVLELIRRGAAYLSDEYAVFDGMGLVHPYPKPLSVRPRGATYFDQPIATDTSAATLGAATAVGPLPLACVVATNYRPGAMWAPRSRTPAQGALILLANALAARTDTERVLSVVRRAATRATVLEGDRGDAGEVAAELISRLTGRLAR